MRELNDTVDQLSVSVNEIAENVTQLAGVAAETKNDGDSVDIKMRETVEVSEKGRMDMEHVSEALNNIELSIRSLEMCIRDRLHITGHNFIFIVVTYNYL